MTPQEKAKEITDKFRTNVVMWSGDAATTNQNAKQCALICVEEIIATVWNASEKWEYKEALWGYWKNVKAEIEKL